MPLHDGHIHIAVPASTRDPRTPLAALPGVKFHYVPDIHPDDMTVVDGLPTTTMARAIIDCAESTDALELLQLFDTAWDRGLLDLDEYAAARGRVEWRPSLEMLDNVFRLFLHTIG